MFQGHRMEDFDALAAALGAGIADLRGCLILSRDGLVLAGQPDAAEQDLKAAWLRFAALGEPQRGFVQFGNEIWSFARWGSYGSFAVTGIGARPGIVIDHMEQVLMVAERARSNGEGQKVANPAPTQPTQATGASPKKKKRTSLRGVPAPIQEPIVIPADGPAIEEAGKPDRGADPPAGDPGPGAGLSSREHEEPAEVDPAAGPEASGDEDEVDRFSLAAEFSRLLQDKRDDVDG
jgi:hypothetical protein